MLKIITLAIALSLSTITAAHSEDCTSRQNYMIMPNGRCLALDYLNILGETRTIGDRVNTQYQSQVEANVELNINEYNRRTETKEERDSRLKTLAKSAANRGEVNAWEQRIEDILYPLHLRNLSIVREGFRR